ncbi:acetoin utilization protein [Stenotrophomonas panacihumi]|uniref:Acetoin utilization protein n=1 Tax=Stenotrophomonas panacihumi TaxID=676599 RepID=A0A0R0AMM5_9GAMM|nr:histone deacetylase family protein [Stenotrophomonas panacihumi]KRG42986.1 acetoin utilization protein [Stenotrophomonas panacihumi]PTN55531.1 acetoin utilization protein [Stenotrophomonas panacihumi]
MLVFTHPACLGHDPGPDHPESPARLDVVVSALREAFDDLEWREAPPAKLGDLCRVHERELIDSVLEQPVEGHRMLDVDTVMSAGSAAAALRAAGAGIAAVDAVMAGHAQTAFCAVRPPGHHATAQTAMGFCLFNNIAVAAAHARDKHGLERVAIVDFDVHHGNGTQAIFERDPAVQYLSTHESGIYPHSGSVYERGVGNIHNALLPPGSGGFRFRNTWADQMLPLLEAFRPQLVLVSAGFDAHMRDPQADLMLEAEDFGWLTAELRKLAVRHAQGRIVSMLEGGYDLQALRESSVAHVAALR